MYGLLVVFVFVLLLTGSAQAQVQDPDVGSFFRDPLRAALPDDDDDDDGIGSKIAGAWIGEGEFSVDLGCDGTFDIGPIPFKDGHTFDVGGSHVVTNPANPNSGLGTWEKIGSRQVSARDLNFGVDATPGGNVTTISIVSMVVDFDKGFNTATTTFGADVYLPTQDPLDPNAVPVACSAGQHTSFRKVSATE
jgi:hypothetical protein